MTKSVTEMTYVELEVAIRELKAKIREEGYVWGRGAKLAEMHESKRIRDESRESFPQPRDPDMEARSMNAAQCIEFLREEAEMALSDDCPVVASNLRECANCIESLLLIANGSQDLKLALRENAKFDKN